MKSLSLIIGVFVFSFLSSCSENDAEITAKKEITFVEPKSIPLTRADMDVSKSINPFAVNFAKTVCTTDENVIVSPFSAQIALGMLCNGANGATQEEVLNVLGYKGNGLADLNAYSQKLSEYLPVLDSTTKFNSANAILSKLDLLSSYKNSVKDCYDAEIFDMSKLGNPIAFINSWCDEKTNHMIPDLMDKSDDFVTALVNALYFQGSWANEFKAKDTQKETFTNSDKSKSKVEMMHQTMEFRYYETSNASVLMMPFGNASYVMRIVLPKDGKTIKDVILGSDEDWHTKSGNVCEVNVRLPKFEMEFKTDLKTVLKQMGMTLAFDSSSADFSNMCSVPLYVEKALQRTKFIVNESGAEAASATVFNYLIMDSGTGIHAKPQKVDFFVNKPFAFTIEERSSETMIFMGYVNKL